MKSILKNLNSNSNSPNVSMTNCTKTGIKIKDTGNGYKHDPFAGIDPFKNMNQETDKIHMNYANYKNSNIFENLDLNIENYSRPELYKLFGFKSSAMLTEENMKYAKHIVLKTHPDKSRLDNKYFVFFSQAYKKILQIYEFQNKTNTKKTIDNNEYFDKDNELVLDKLFDNKKDLKNPENFNKWFNNQFEKHRIDDPIEHGYGSWLKSDEDIIFTPQNINKDTMNTEMEKRKKEVQSIVNYKGVNDPFTSSSFGGSSLMEYNSNFSSGTIFNSDGMGYTDLRQAYVESVIPVTQEDYNNKPKFRNVDDYKRHRELDNLNPLFKEEAMRELFNANKQKDEESAALAFYYAQQSEKAKKSQDIFWSGLKQINY